MKNSISRPTLYLMLVSLILVSGIVVFAFFVLIPQGQEYRVKKAELAREKKELRVYENFNDETFAHLKELQHDNRHIIDAFANKFDVERFVKMHQEHFVNLHVVALASAPAQEDFSVYEVNTTSRITSPSSFYEFLDAINKSDWIIDINFPIEFKREGDLINSSFTMKVYANSPETNSSEEESQER